MSEVILVVGERFTGRSNFVEKKFKQESRFKVIRSVGIQRSLHWGCKQIKQQVEREKDRKKVIHYDEMLIGRGARDAIIKAARGVNESIKISAIFIKGLGGEIRRMWEREWLRSSTPTGAYYTPLEPCEVEAQPIQITEGFDIVTVQNTPLYSMYALTTVSLILDASVLLHKKKLRDGVSKLLHSWYTIASSTKVVIVVIPPKAVLSQGHCDSTSTINELIDNVRNALSELAAPFPIYMYTSVACSELTRSLNDAIETCPSHDVQFLSASDIAYLQHRHCLDLSYAHVASSSHLVGSPADKLKFLCKALGMRYIDASALFTALDSGAEAAGVIRRISESFTAGESMGFIQSGKQPGTAYPLVECSPSHPINQRTKLNIQRRSNFQITVHEVIITDANTSIFQESLPAKEFIPESDDEDDDNITQTQKDQIGPFKFNDSVLKEFFIDQNVLTSAHKFFKKNMTSFVDYSLGQRTTINMICNSADSKSKYTVKVVLSASGKSFSSISCSCGKNNEGNDGMKKCRHAAAAAIHICTKGTPQMSVTNLEEQSLAVKEEDNDDEDIFRDIADAGGPDSTAQSDVKIEYKSEDVCTINNPPPATKNNLDILQFIDRTSAPPAILTPAGDTQSEVTGDSRLKFPSLQKSNLGSNEVPEFMRLSTKKIRKNKAAAASPVKAPVETKSSKKAIRSELYPNAPKRPQTPYFVFAAEYRSEFTKSHKGESAAVVAKLLGEKWRLLTPEQQQVYRDKSAAAKEIYTKELNEYKKTEEYIDGRGKEILKERTNRVNSKPTTVIEKVKSPVKSKPKRKSNDDDDDDVGSTQRRDASFYAKLQKDSAWRLENGNWVHEWDTLSQLPGVTGDDDVLSEEISEGELIEFQPITKKEELVEQSASLQPPTPAALLKSEMISQCVTEPFATFDEEAEIITREQSIITSRSRITAKSSFLSDLKGLTEGGTLADDDNIEDLFFGVKRKKEK